MDPGVCAALSDFPASGTAPCVGNLAFSGSFVCIHVLCLMVCTRLHQIVLEGRCPYFDATIHYSGLMAAVSAVVWWPRIAVQDAQVWRKKSASRIQRAWRGYRSRGEPEPLESQLLGAASEKEASRIFLQLRQPQLRAEAPTLSRPCARCESCALLWPLSTYAARAPFLEHIA